MAIRAPTSAQTARFSWTSTWFFFVFTITPTVTAVPTESINGSLCFRGSMICSLSAPTTRSMSVTSNFSRSHTGGSFPTSPATCPARASLFVSAGSSFVATPRRPPGAASVTRVLPALMEVIFVSTGSHFIRFSTWTCRPGRISISSPSCRMPRMSDPPMTPPFTSRQLQPGLLISNDRAMNSTGSISGFRAGSGTTRSRVWIRAPILIPFCAETGMMGAFSAIVPLMNRLICL